MRRIYLWGAGDGAVELVHLIEDINQSSKGRMYKICALVADKEPKYTSLQSIPFINTTKLNWKKKIKEDSQAVITVGIPKVRESMFREIAEIGLSLPVLIHPTAVVSKSCKIEKGCIIGANATLSYAVSLQPNCYISFNSSIGHHSKIGMHSVLSPGTRVGGSVICGNNLFTGLNAVFVPRIEIGSYCTISAGALVTQNIKDNAKVIAEKSRILNI